jgi:hypothetical protein
VESERRWLVPAVFVTVVALSLTLAAVLIGRSDAGQQFVRRAREVVGAEPTPTTTTAAPAVVASSLVADSFDPEGSDGEHDGDLPNLVDGDPTTSWDTEGYVSRTFGIKSGVGVHVTLPARAELGDLVITSPSNGWSASVYVADAPATDLGGWGEPVAQRTAIAPGVTTISLDTRGRSVLVWITDLGDAAPQARTTIDELAVTTR